MQRFGSCLVFWPTEASCFSVPRRRFGVSDNRVAGVACVSRTSTGHVLRDMAATPPSSSNNLLKTVAKSKLKKRREEEVEVEQMWQSV